MGKYTKTVKKEKLCRNCGKAFLAFSQSSYACSKECRDICISKELIEKRKPFLKKLKDTECIFCKSLFTQKYTWQKYCEVKCQEKHANSLKPKVERVMVNGKLRDARYGRKQNPEHVAKRFLSLAENLKTRTKVCVKCAEEYTPTKATQRYCSSRCWVSGRQRKKHQRIYLKAIEYQALMDKQDGKCAICNIEGGLNNRGDKLAVDHCHTSGKIRGLLCHRCNTAIGLLKDNIENLNSAINYLKTNS